MKRLISIPDDNELFLLEQGLVLLSNEKQLRSLRAVFLSKTLAV